MTRDVGGCLASVVKNIWRCAVACLVWVHSLCAGCMLAGKVVVYRSRREFNLARSCASLIFAGVWDVATNWYMYVDPETLKLLLACV